MCVKSDRTNRINTITAMRDEGKTQREIAEFLVMKLDTLKGFAKRNGIKFAFETTRKCEWCKEEYKTAKRNSKSCSRKCSDNLYEIKRRDEGRVCKLLCKQCGDNFESSSYNARYCTSCKDNRKALTNSIREEERAQRELDKARKQLLKTMKLLNSKTRECEHCNCSYVFTKDDDSGTKYCGDECKDEASKGYKKSKSPNINKDKRLRRNGKADYSISLEKLHAKDDGICHICGTQTDYNDMVITDEGYYIAGNNYPSIDHVIPIAKGGLHQWDNVKLAHRICNSLKRDSILK